MNTGIYAATKKGLFHITRQAQRWAVARVSFLGDNLSMLLPDRRDGTIYAAQDLIDSLGQIQRHQRRKH